MDYTSLGGTLTFNSGTRVLNIQVTTINDHMRGKNKTLRVNLSRPIGATLGTSWGHTLTILDMDS